MDLTDIKPQDEVFVSWRTGYSVAKVVKVTKTQIILINGGRYRKDTGNLVGKDTWSTNCIKKLTPELREQFNIRQLSRKAAALLEGIKLKTDREFLQQLIAAIEPFVERKEK